MPVPERYRGCHTDAVRLVAPLRWVVRLRSLEKSDGINLRLVRFISTIITTYIAPCRTRRFPCWSESHLTSPWNAQVKDRLAPEQQTRQKSQTKKSLARPP